MPLQLRDQLKTLGQLQELDLKIDALRRKKAALPAAMKALEDSFQQAKKRVDGKQLAIQEIEKTKRQTLAAIDLNKDRFTRANTKLESVQNSQEFAAANKELDQLRKLSINLEDQVKKADADIATANTDLGKLNEDLTKIQGERDQQLQALSGEGAQFDAEIQKLVGERTAFTSQIDKRIVSQYDRVRAARGGIGVAPAVGGRCKVCNMAVPPQLYNEVLRGNNLQACPSCQRILYVPGDSAENNAGAQQSAH